MAKKPVYQNHHIIYASETNRKRMLRRRYGLTAEDYDWILKEQNYCCAICGKHMSKFSKRLYVDHNHKTGFVRGLVCNYCNSERLGSLRDNKVVWEGLGKYITKALENDKKWGMQVAETIR